MLAGRLAHALFAEPFDSAQARRVGMALVDAHFTGTEALNHTVALLGDQLLAHLGVDSPELRARLARLQGWVAAGFAKQLKDRTLAEQEEIRQAALTARREAEAALRASEARFRAVFAGAAIAIGIGDPWGQILDANQALADMLGYSTEELCEHAVTDFVHPDDLADVLEVYQLLINDRRDHLRTEARFYRRDGGVLWAHLALSLIRDDDGEPSYLVAMGEDVTERHRLRTRLQQQALHDPLTRLPNRLLFFDRLAEVFVGTKAGARVGLCYLDVDGFKTVNDSLGHDVGDELLVALASRLEQSLSPTGHLIARMGGDEFVVLVRDSAGVGQVIEVANRILGTLAAPIRVRGYELSVSASIGIVERPVAETDPTDLMRAADITLYWAKADSKGRWAVYEPERHQREVARYTPSAFMLAALQHQQFSLDFQPVVGLVDGVVHSVEALVRWQHPQLGLLHPDQFIPLAETGLVVPLGRWVLERACWQARTWQDLSPQGPGVSVNLTLQQCEDPMLVSDVRRILTETELEPDRLQLELTESAITGAAEQPVAALWELSELGVRIAIDDFGGGYANPAYVHSLPAHQLKLAGSFLDGLGSAEEPDAIGERVVATMVSLAHTLDLPLTAKRVESRFQAERLRALGCDEAQGWYIARPGPADDILRLLDTQPSRP